MKIVWVSHSSSYTGGAEHSMTEAVKGLIGAGHKIHVVVPEMGELADRLTGLGAEVSAVPCYANWVYSGFTPNLHYRTRRLLSNLWRGKLLARHFKRMRPDLVVSCTIGSPAGALAARLAGIPHVWDVRELFGKETHDQAGFDLGAPLSLRLMDKLSRRIMVNSAAVREKYKEWIPIEKLRVVYCAVEVPPQPLKPEASDGRFRLVIVGRISPGKRQEDAVRALAALARRGLDIHLSIVGNHRNDYGAFLQRLAKELDVEDRVAFVGYTPSPHALIAESDAALMCSRGEPFGRVTVEAMKLGTPVIGAAGAGTSELIQHGTTGMLYRLGDAEDLAGCVETLYRDRGLLKRMGAEAKAWATERFNIENYTSGLLKVFEEVCVKS